MIYRALGKLVVRHRGLRRAAVGMGFRYVFLRFRRQIRFAIGFALAAALIGAYLASREVSEG